MTRIFRQGHAILGQLYTARRGTLPLAVLELSVGRAEIAPSLAHSSLSRTRGCRAVPRASATEPAETHEDKL
jgi:hypothetical protein